MTQAIIARYDMENPVVLRCCPKGQNKLQCNIASHQKLDKTEHLRTLKTNTQTKTFKQDFKKIVCCLQ